ncbi:hypothetical protein ACVW0A_000145 [Pseudomonas sp. TE3610]
MTRIICSSCRQAASQTPPAYLTYRGAFDAALRPLLQGICT